jgi:NAD+ synthase
MTIDEDPSVVLAPKLTKSVLDLDCAAEADRIARRMVGIVAGDLHRRGVIIALSGGVDSSVCGALAVRAFGPKKVFGLLLPEVDSSSSSTERGRLLAEQLGISYELVNIGPTLEAIGCYRWRDEAIQAVFPEYAPTWKSKIAISGGSEGRINFFKLVVQSPTGEIKEARLPIKEYLQIVAATNFKQRIRKTVEYFHADRLNYAVIGTPNRLEYDQGFFVKNGDGAADIKPIAHLYKTQVYALARYFNLPDEICSAKPTTDTYSMQQGQDEFYFALSYDKMDYALWAHNHGVGSANLAQFLGVDEEFAAYISKDIEAKRRTTAYLHARPALIDPVSEVAV